MASNNFAKGLKRSALTVALGICFAGGVQAQSTSGSIFGKADAGQTVTIVSGTGLTRTVTADANGNFNAVSLPAGSYKVESGGSTRDVVVKVGSGAQVDFSGATNLAAVTVVGSSTPVDIDISQTDTRTVFTAEDLQKFALPRDVNSVALMAPGVINSSSYNYKQSNIGSFGGSAASENAYYINGYPVTNPLTNLGATTLGFDSIAQQQVLTGGYGAEYGRSTGGVVSLITKRGSNEWHGGVYAIYSPASLRQSSKNIFYPDTGKYSEANHYASQDGKPELWTDNKLFDYNSGNTSETLTYGVWAAGPIWKDRLFIYANAERTETDQETSRYTGNLQGKTAAGASAISSTSRSQAWGVNNYTYPRWTAKVDWNITDDHILELTAVQDNETHEYEYFGLNYDTLERDNVSYNGGHRTEDNSRLYIAKYTGYLTDNLTISAQYGEQEVEHVQDALAGYDPTKTYISSLSASTVPAAFAGIGNPQPYSTITDDGTDNTEGYRFDVSYLLGDHELRVGVDHFEAVSYIGDRYTGPGNYLWQYYRQDNPAEAISASDGVGAPVDAGGFGTQGYYVSKRYSAHGGAVSTEQQAYYLEDRWQVTDNLLLSLGVRNDSFTNYNGDKLAYVTQKNNWAPRIGFSWDVKGDSKFKVFGNAGRYHLALPNNVAIRGANASLSTQQYFTYTGIAADGTPIGLSAVPLLNTSRLCSNGGVSTNLECGKAPDPATVAIKGLKAHFQDEYILGMQRVETDTFSWGAKFTYRDLKSAIDDTCPGECRIFNPGEAATFLIPNGSGGYTEVSYTKEELGFPKLKRRYVALDLYAQYAYNDFFGKVEYTLSKNYGNAEGQLNSSLDTGGGGQADVSVTSDWDLPELAFGANGLLPNNRKHQIKAFGSLKLTDEFRVGGSTIIQSGRPKDCKSYWPYAKAGLYNNGFYYFYCGVPGGSTASTNPANAAPESDTYYYSPRGSAGTTPWTATFNLNFTYTPNWLEGLTASVDVLNVFNTQVPTAYNPRSANSRSTVDPTFNKVSYYTSPRSARFTVRYDF